MSNVLKCLFGSVANTLTVLSLPLTLVLVLNSYVTLAKTDLDDILERYYDIYGPSKTATHVAVETVVPPDVFTAKAMRPVCYGELPLPRSSASITERPTTSSTKFLAVDFARRRCSDNSLCQSIDGIWFSTNFESVFEVRLVPEILCRFKIRSSGVGWNGFGECLFPNHGPISVFIGERRTGKSAAFVGQCYVVDGKDTITGNYIFKTLTG